MATFHLANAPINTTTALAVLFLWEVHFPFVFMQVVSSAGAYGTSRWRNSLGFRALKVGQVIGRKITTLVKSSCHTLQQVLLDNISAGAFPCWVPHSGFQQGHIYTHNQGHALIYKLPRGALRESCQALCPFPSFWWRWCQNSWVTRSWKSSSQLRYQGNHAAHD